MPAVRVSGLAKTGLGELVETLSTVAELRDLRARAEGQVQGWVLESRVDKGRGYVGLRWPRLIIRNVATILVTRGTLTPTTHLIAGQTWARVRQMTDSAGRAIKSAPPGTPVSMTGWKDLPAAGDAFLEAPSEDAVKKAVTNRLLEIERLSLIQDVEAINEKRKEEREERVRLDMEAQATSPAVGEAGVAAPGVANERDVAIKKELRLVIKADVSGTVEAVVGVLEGIGNKEAGVKIIQSGVGEVNESDIALAEVSEGATLRQGCTRTEQ